MFSLRVFFFLVFFFFFFLNHGIYGGDRLTFLHLPNSLELANVKKEQVLQACQSIGVTMQAWWNIACAFGLFFLCDSACLVV